MIRHLVPIACRCLLPVFLTQPLWAAPYTYVDATPTNTTLNGAALVHGTNVVNNGTTGSSTDNLWTYRTDSGAATFEGSSYFESDNASSSGDREATGNLVTTINPGAIGTYDVVVLFTRTANRDVAARIGSAPTTGDIFTISNALNADQAVGSPAIVFDASYGNTRGTNSGAAYLGQVTTTSAGQSISIYVNGLASTGTNDDERTQYEGIAYRLADPPEPKHRDVFLIAGQSNADGRGLKAELTSPLAGYAGQQTAVRIHYTNPAYTNADKNRYRKWVTLEPGYSVAPGDGTALPTSTFGVEIGAAKVLSAHFPNPAFIKVTKGGTTMTVPGTDWYPAPLNSPDAGPLYKALIESTQLALQEIATAGDTCTVHAIYWHQGESDSDNIAGYGAVLTTFIESVRRDLDMPNLRFIVGELASTKPIAFRDVQWQVARSVPNAAFLSSSGLVTFEGTHFTTASMTTFGERLGHALRTNRDTLDFNIPTCSAGALDRQDECAGTSGLTVAATATQGEYTGGQAAGHVGTGGAYNFTRRHMLPLDGARSMQADFFPGDSGYDNEADADSSLLVSGWGVDAGNDGQFAEAESAMGFGLHHTGTFRIQIGATSHLATGFIYQTDHWYRLNLSWSEPDAGGNRTVSLFARDRSTGTDLNGGSAVLSLSVPANDFDGNPIRWLGLGCRATRGLVDNIRVMPPGFSSWMDTFHPSLTGGETGDDDNDGIANIIEFAFGLDPLRTDSASALPQPFFGLTSATVSFTPLATQPGILHTVEWSRNLSSWNAVSGTPNGNQLQFVVPTTGEPSVFIRHGVELTP